MSLQPTRLTIGGADRPLSGVLADVTVRHGRVDVYDSPSPSTFQCTLQGVDRAYTRPFNVGASLVFKCSDSGGAEAPRFTGRVTDASLDGDRLTMIAVGPLSRLQEYTVGAADYPAENWSARVARAFSDAGLSALLQLQPAAADPQVAARPAQPVALSQYLGEISDDVGAAIADTVDGKILVQAIGSRSLASMVDLNPALVAYVPAFVQVLPLANVVTVQYAASGSVTVQDNASAALYGYRPQTITTTIVLAADATARANERLSRSAYSHWNLPSAPYLEGRAFTIGQPLRLTLLPTSSPYKTWTPILEGWQDTISSDLDGDGLDWTMELSLSDPLSSGLTLPWNAVPTGDKWNTISPTVAWKDALTLDDLEGWAA